MDCIVKIKRLASEITRVKKDPFFLIKIKMYVLFFKEYNLIE